MMKEPANDPRARAREAERHPSAPAGPGETFTGWGIIGLPFDSGHVLALRCFSASSVGPPYNAVWHRRPDGTWTMYVDTAADCSCPRYFGRAVDRVIETEIVISWSGPRSVRVVTGLAGFYWVIRVASTPLTRLFNALARVTPAWAWRSPRALGLMGRVAGPLLRAGRLRLHGRAPNGHRFMARPRRVWVADDSSAAVDGEDVGVPAPLETQDRLGDFRIPQRGLLAFGESVFRAPPRVATAHERAFGSSSA